MLSSVLIPDIAKKTCQIIIDTGNDYVMAVKDNQPKLHSHIKRIAAMRKPTSRVIETERTRDRLTMRIVEVFDDISGIGPEWTGINSLIKIERYGTRKGKKYHEIVCYISSLICTAKEFALGIRGHWGIENCLHWGGSAVGGFPDLRRLPLKDVVLKEDSSTTRLGNAPANLSIIRSIALNILRRNGHTSMTIAQRLIPHDIDKLLLLVE